MADRVDELNDEEIQCADSRMTSRVGAATIPRVDEEVIRRSSRRLCNSLAVARVGSLSSCPGGFNPCIPRRRFEYSCRSHKFTSSSDLLSCHLTALGPLPSYIYSLDPSIAP